MVSCYVNVHGTSNVESQIAKTHLQTLLFSSKKTQLKNGPVRDFIMQSKNQVKIIEHIDGFCTVGIYKKK